MKLNCCGREYTLEEFRKLEHVSTENMPDGSGDRLEYYQCPCGSTRTVMLDKNDQPIGIWLENKTEGHDEN